MLSSLRVALKNVISTRKGGEIFYRDRSSNLAALMRAVSLREKREVARLIRKKQNYFAPGLTKLEIIRRKKFAKKLIRELNKNNCRKRHQILPKKILAIRQKNSILLESLLPNRKNLWKSVTKRERDEHVIELNNFSILDNAKETINFLQQIAYAETQWLGFKIDFADNACMDITPYLILGLMRQDMAPLVSGGNITPAVTGMIDAVGLSDLLSITHINRRHIQPTFYPFRVRHRRATGTSTSKNIALEPSSREALTDDLVDTVDNWLKGLAQRELNKDGKGHLSAIVGEIINNAERHSDPVNRDGDWAIAGFLSSVKENEDSNRTKYFCCLSIISLGATISDSILNCEDPETKEYMERYIERHINTTGMTKDCLAAIYALQDGVSRLQQDDTGERSRGGVGMMDMVQFVGALGSLGAEDEPPEITVLSGEACLNIRKPHFEYVFHQIKGDRPRQIWFNDKNDIAVAPDPAYVCAMPVRFPGTAVAMRFCISPNSSVSKNEEGGE